MAADGSGDGDDDEGSDEWLSSRKTTNSLLGLLTVVTAAGFISIGDGGFGGLRIVAELVLVVVLVGTMALFLGWVMRDEEA